MSNIGKMVSFIWQSLFVSLAMGCTATVNSDVKPLPPVTTISLAPANALVVDGVKINYTSNTLGSPYPTLVLIHGFGASLQTWADIYPLLSEHYPIVALDLKGAGFSDKPKDALYAISDQALLLIKFMQALNLTNVILVGHSMGGGVALLTYLRSRETAGKLAIRGLVLIDSAGYPQELPFFVSDVRSPTVRFLSVFLSAEFRSRYVLERIFWQKEKITADRIQRYAYFFHQPGFQEALMQTAKQIVPRDLANITAKFQTIRIPTLVIWGKHDPVIPIEHAYQFTNDIPHSKLGVIPNAGHVPQEEDPTQVFDFMNAFVHSIK